MIGDNHGDCKAVNTGRAAVMACIHAHARIAQFEYKHARMNMDK